MSKHEPIKTRDKNSGTQKLYRFDNGYGASVIQGPYSYGGDRGLSELGVIVWDGEQFGLTYETPVTSDVEGHLSDDDVDALLDRIAALPARDGGVK